MLFSLSKIADPNEIMHFAESHLVLNCMLSFGLSKYNRNNESVYKFPLKKRLKDKIYVYNGG